ncbi:hypothetical protein F5X96DRAFT_692241 [Biscogniauxia mediterranea]|nr:hypothetical protein F5X96DRAFT_692241 [Biscogniauxia mediterranea]
MSENIQASKTFTVRGNNLQEALEEVAMALPMMLALTICPAMLGTQEAIRQSQSKTKREEHRARRCNLIVSCVKPSIRSRDIDGKLVVLKDNKLYITTSAPLPEDEESVPPGNGYPFSGYYLPYPDAQYEGLVSTICDEPPMLNWIYVDKNTYEVKYGVRADAQEHLTGPFDCTKQDRRMTLEGWEGFAAVEEYPGIWALYFDRDDDGLLTKIPMGTRVLEVELTRREKKERKPEPDPNQAKTLDEMMKQHKEKTAREEAEKAEFMRKQQEELRLAEEKQAAIQQQQQQAEQQKLQQEPEPPQQPQEKRWRPLYQPNAELREPEVATARLSELELQRLELQRQADQPSHAMTRSPSALTDNLSIWSAVSKVGDNSDADSATAVSSLGDRHEAYGHEAYGHEAYVAPVQESVEIPFYKKPYVEEDDEPIVPERDDEDEDEDR